MANVVKYEAKDGQEVSLTFESVKQFLVSGKPELVSKQEMLYFMGICKSRGLNPFAKDCFLIKYNNDPAAIITSIDFFRSRARAQEDCQGWKSGVIVEDEKGNLRYSSGLVREKEKLVGGWFKAKPKGWETEFELEVNLAGYLKKKNDGTITKFWQPENQPTMIRKVAESQGLRELWPNEFGKLYLDEEIDRTEMMEDVFASVSQEAKEHANKETLDMDVDTEGNATVTNKAEEKQEAHKTEVDDIVDEVARALPDIEFE